MLRSILAAGLLLLPSAARALMPEDCVLRCDVFDPATGLPDGSCSGSDYSQLLANWEQQNGCGPLYADFDWDCQTSASDYVILLQEWEQEACVYARQETIAALPRSGDAAQAWAHVQAWAHMTFTPDPFCDQDSND